MRKLLSASLVALLLSIGLSAAPVLANTPQDDYNGQAAMTYWGAYPSHCGYITVYHWTPASSEGGYTDYANCIIYINSAAFTSWPAGRACMIELHEWGHLLGYGHSSDPNSVMYYAMDPWHNIPYVRWPCSW